MSWKITPKIAAELVAHEGIVLEAYKDSVDVWTWSVGITSASGHKVWPRYVDNPQTPARCLEVYEWVLRTNYLPAVQEAFAGFELTETQLGGALSFHYNTGGIDRATWVKDFRRGDMAAAREAIMNWRRPAEIIPRRRKEQALFFDGEWSSDGKGVQYPVKKPSYRPNFGAGQVVDVIGPLKGLFG